MKFYNREKELDELQKVRELAFSEHSKLTVLTGRRRIGKTSLIFKSCENTPTLYWFEAMRPICALSLQKPLP